MEEVQELQKQKNNVEKIKKHQERGNLKTNDNLSDTDGVGEKINGVLKRETEILIPERDLVNGNINGKSVEILEILKSAPSKLPEKDKVIFKNAIFFFSFALSDFFSVIISHLISRNFFGVSVDLFLSFLLVFLVSLVSKLYSKNFAFWDEVMRIFRISITSGIIYYLFESYHSRVSSILYFVPFFTSYLAFSILFRKIAREILWTIGVRRRVLIVGAGLGGQKVLRAIASEKHLGYDIIGFLDDDRSKHFKSLGKFRGKDVLVLGSTCEIWNIIEESDVDEVILAVPSLGDKALTALAAHLQKFVSAVTIVPDMFGLPVNVETRQFLGEQTILLSVRNNLANPLNRLIKDIFDLVLSSFIFVLILPLFLIIAILIKLDSPGPIIFSHERVGKGGKKFKCYKFRTMYVDNEKILEEHFRKHPEDREYFLKTGKIPGRDPRITRLGRFLRKFSLDELPQIINVLKGDMSLVGPRALVEDEVKQCQDYYMEWAKYIKPGITGLAQVMGRANISHIDKNILSIWYMKNWSLWLDVIIIFKTIKVVLKTEGAY